MGVVSSYGLGLKPFWAGLLGGIPAIRQLELFDGSRHRTVNAGEVQRIELERATEPTAHRELARASRCDRFALLAAREAIESAGLLSSPELQACGVFIGSSTAGMFEGERVFKSLIDSGGEGRGTAQVSRLAAHPLGGPGDFVARTFGLWGPNESSASACAAGTMAIGTALETLRSGEAERALAGGADALCEATYGGFNSLRAVDEHPSRPFRRDRAGLSLGEGAAVLVLETLAAAEQRGARILAQLSGAGSSCDAYHMTAPHPEGRGAARAMGTALADAGIEAAEIDFINAHGTGTPHNDSAEWRALEHVFGDRARHVPVTTIKGSVGHTLGACGALEAVATIQCLLESRVPPVPGEGSIDEDCPVDLVRGAPRELERCNAALSLNLAFGGANSALVLECYPANRARRP